jgi:hypothetical protein
MRFRVVDFLGLLLLAGCSRDLAVPPRSTLALQDAFPSAAPNEQLALAVSGGAQPYRFALAQGGDGSGGARVDASGAYTAGPLGPAVDLVEVHDASGAVVVARVSVGPPLQVAQGSAFVAPGGRVAFAPSGGKAPFRLEFTGAGAHHGTVQGTEFLVEPGGGCGGTVSAPSTVTLRLVDATGTATPELTVEIGRGLDIFPAAGVGGVAPHESIAFLASGGQPPYQFAMAANPSGGPGVDAGRGSYTAGPTGDVTDQIQVTDANGQAACAPATVGPGLDFGFSNTRARPGQAMKVLASGGRPPYRYQFAEKGNRSRAVLDPVTGDYLPGFNTGATDLLTVSDATGAPALPAKAMRVGAVAVDATNPDQGCFVADVDGNGFQDAVILSSEATATRVELRSGAAPRITRTTVAAREQSALLADVSGDGRADLVSLSLVDDSLEISLGQGDGTFAAGALRARGTTVDKVAVARGSPRIFTSSSSYPGCSAGLAWTEVDPSTGGLRPFTCVAGQGPVSSLVAGDFDGDGQVDVAYTRSSVPQSIFYRLASDAFATELSVALPGTWRYQYYQQAFNPAVEVRRDGAATSDAVFVVYDGLRTAPGTRTGLATLRGGASGLTLQQVDRVDFGGLYNVLGMTAIGLGPGGRPRLVVSNGADGQVLVYDFPITAGPLAPSSWQVEARDYRVVGLCSGDLDRDGAEDLVLTPRATSTLTDILVGELDGGWERRPHYTSLGTGPVGDVDGDGSPDFLSVVTGLGFEVLFTADGEVALGPATPTDGMPFAGAAADWDGDGSPDLMTRLGATGFTLLPGREGGRFAPPIPVAVASPSGAAYDPISINFRPAELGGVGPGPDLVTYVRAGAQLNFAALIFSDTTHATYGVTDIPFSSDYAGVADLDGDGLDDLVGQFPDSTLALRVAMARPGQAGATWPYLPSVEVLTGAADVATLAGSIPVPGSVPPRRRVVVVGTAAISLVDAPAGTPEVRSIPIAVTGTPLGLADVTGDGWPDLVLARSGALHPLTGLALATDLLVFRGTTDGAFEAAPDPALTLQLQGAVSGWVLPLPARPADLLLLAGPTYVILHNDGAGHFR